MAMEDQEIYGMMAEFDEPDELLAAARRTYEAGYREMDAFSPFPIPGLPQAIGARRTWLSVIVLLGGVGGALGAYAMQAYATVYAYPLNVGGRPLHSWPSYVPIIFEVTILGAGFMALMGMLALNNLPMPYHPVFNEPRFEFASRTHFFLVIESKDRLYDPEETRAFLETMQPTHIVEIPY